MRNRLYTRPPLYLQASATEARAASQQRLDWLPAVDVQLGPVHVARLFGAQEINGFGHLRGLAETAQRNVLLHDPVGAWRQYGGVDFSRRDGIDANSAGTEVGR